MDEQVGVLCPADVEALRLLVRAGAMSSDVPWGPASVEAGNQILSLAGEIQAQRKAIEELLEKDNDAPPKASKPAAVK